MCELRKAEDLAQHYDGLVLPGGESTVQGKLLKELGMFDTVKSQIEAGMPVLATCAGLILLAENLEGGEHRTFADYACDREAQCLRKTAWQLSIQKPVCKESEKSR